MRWGRRCLAGFGAFIAIVILLRIAVWNPLYVTDRPSSQLVIHSQPNPTAAMTLTFSEQQGNSNQIRLPNEYPVHRQLPPGSRLREGMLNQLKSQCHFDGASQPSVLPAYQMTALQRDEDMEQDDALMYHLRDAYSFVNADSYVFWVALSGPPPSTAQPGDSSPDIPWWIPSDADNLPCTALVQRKLWEWQHPSQGCSDAYFLVTKLKEGPHGIGSALTLIAHDLLSAMMLGRVLVIKESSWFFAPSSCGSRRGWNCFFAPPTHCNDVPHPQVVKSLREARAASGIRSIRKQSFDIPGLGRNDLPSIEVFLGGSTGRQKCQAEINEWKTRPENRYVMGTIERGTDPMLTYLLAQTLRYIMRAPQPWFRSMLLHNLERVGYNVLDARWQVKGIDSNAFPVVFMQERGEVAKFREYYNTFGCHTVKADLYIDYARKICSIAGGEEKCAAYISGGTPYSSFLTTESVLQSLGGMHVLSTWKHPSLDSTKESIRWGASAPFATWVDLYAGVAADAWICIVQSNWCRLINFLRMTAGRASCTFVDAGILMLSSPRDREKYCIVNSSWPTKMFSNGRKATAPLN